MRNEVRQFGIDVVVIEPGGIASEWEEIAGREVDRWSGAGAYSGTVNSLFDIAQGVQTGNLKVFLFDDDAFRQLGLPPQGKAIFSRRANDRFD